MPAKRLTEKGVARLRAPATRTETPDAITPGLYLIAQPSGKKSWAVRARVAGRPIKFTLGSSAALDVAAARAAARVALAAVARGEDPRVLRRAAEAATVTTVVADWLARDQAGNRGHDEVKRLFDRHVLPRWGPRPVASITRADCRAVVDAIADRGKVIHARRVHAHVRRFLAWCAERDLIPANPMAGLKKPGREVARERVLTDAELVAVWNAADAVGWPFGPIARLLILTGARRAWIGALRWDEVAADGTEIRLAGERTKNGEPHAIPLSPTARELVATLPRVGRKPEFAFATRGTPVSGWSKAKRALDEASGVTGWRLHDLRRTVATGLQRLGQKLEVIEAVLGHTSGSRGGIVGVYQRHAFEDEKRRALDAWARHLRKIVAGDVARVVPIDGGKRAR
jgi:integrase